jgi:hypothetical protein
LTEKRAGPTEEVSAASIAMNTEETIKRTEGFPERAAKLKERMRSLKEEADQNPRDQDGITGRRKHPRHPITMENTPEETIRIMESFPERADKIRELIRGLRKTHPR